MPAFGPREILRRLPTTDLYFLNPLAKLRSLDREVVAVRVRHLVENAFMLDRIGVVVRYGSARHIDRLRRGGAERIVYIADDDFAAGADDRNLPEAYRRRLADFIERDWPVLNAAADIVVVPGKVLAETYGGRARIVPPVWHRPPAPLDHFDAAKRIELAHLGTRSHRVDLIGLAPLLSDILDEHRGVRLTVFSGVATPASLRSHARVRVRDAKAWWRYRRALPRMRFHLALYPLADTAFNRARSANKLYEHALVGAASLMSPNPALRDAAGASTDIFVEGGIDEWRDRIGALLGAFETMRGQAEATRSRILAADPAAQAAEVWRKILG